MKVNSVALGLFCISKLCNSFLLGGKLKFVGATGLWVTVKSLHFFSGVSELNCEMSPKASIVSSKASTPDSISTLSSLGTSGRSLLTANKHNFVKIDLN